MLKTLPKLSFIATILYVSACSDDTSPTNAWELGNESQTQTNSGATDPCDPLNDTCAEGRYCQYTNGALKCVAEGDVLPDNTHVPPSCPGTCSRGGICMPSDFGVGDALCFQPCDLTEVGQNSNCRNSRHTCRQAYGDNDEPLGFGLCNY